MIILKMNGCNNWSWVMCFVWNNCFWSYHVSYIIKLVTVNMWCDKDALHFVHSNHMPWSHVVGVVKLMCMKASEEVDVSM